MTKKSKKKKGFFKTVYRVIDKLIVIPISRLVYNLQSGLKKKGSIIEKALNRSTFLIFLSLALAVVLFLLIDNKVVLLVENNAEVVTNVPVNVKFNEEAYVIEGVPSTVDITITGRKSDIYLSKQLGEYEVTLDLSNYSASDSAYKVYFTYSKNIDNLTYKLDPSYVSVMIKNKVSSVSSISYELINQDKLDSKLSVKNVTLSKSEVVVKGSDTALEKIAWIKALVDLDNSDLDEAGTYDLDNVLLVAYDNQGKILNNIEIVPGTISATVELDSYSASIPIEIKTTGKLIDGKAIASITINNSSEFAVTAYGDEASLSGIKSIPVSINVDGYGKDNAKTYTVALTKPNGVRYMNESTVNVALTFGSEEQKEVSVANNIARKNLGANLNANIISGGDITVICKGVASVLETIDESDISAYVDLAGLGAGDHEVEVKIENNNPLVKYTVSSTITVRITNE